MSIVSASARHVKSRPPSIGILGGVGAIASARFHLDLVEAWAKAKNAQTDADFPEILHYSRHMWLGATGVVDAEATQWVIEAMLHELRECDQVAVLCNSIIRILPKRIKLLTPVAACRDALKGVTRAWLLASESTIRDHIYHDAYPHVEWDTIAITPQIQEAISGRHISTPSGMSRAHEIEIPIVLGCTELSTAHLNWPNTISPTDEMIRILTTHEPHPTV